MSDELRVIDIPVTSKMKAFSVNVDVLLAKLKELPLGKALEVNVRPGSKNATSNLHTVAHRRGVEIKTKKTSENTIAVWMVRKDVSQ